MPFLDSLISTVRTEHYFKAKCDKSNFVNMFVAVVFCGWHLRRRNPSFCVVVPALLLKGHNLQINMIVWRYNTRPNFLHVSAGASLWCHIFHVFGAYIRCPGWWNIYQHLLHAARMALDRASHCYFRVKLPLQRSTHWEQLRVKGASQACHGKLWVPFPASSLQAFWIAFLFYLQQQKSHP